MSALRRSRRFHAGSVLLLASACTSIAPPPPTPPDPAPITVESPVTVAIVQASRDPWTERASQGLAQRLRSRGLLVMTDELATRALTRYGLDPLAEQDPARWMRAFAVDAVAILVPSEATLDMVGLTARCALEADVRTLDLRRGTELPETRALAHATASAESGYDAIERTDELLAALGALACGAAADELGSRLTNALNWSAIAKRDADPRLGTIEVQPRAPQPAWATVNIEIEGEPGLKARAAITGMAVTARRDAPPIELAAAEMAEPAPGHYRASVRLPPRARPDGRITAELLDRFGVLSRTSSGALALPVDAAPPGPPVDLAAEQIDDPPGVVLDWQPASAFESESLDGVPHYRVYRATALPLRFEPIGESMVPAFLDTASILNPQQETSDRYYAVVSVDAVGNPSPPSDLIAIRAGSTGEQSHTLLPRIPWRKDPDLPVPVPLGRARVTIGDGHTARTRTVSIDDLRIDIATARLRGPASSDGTSELLAVAIGSSGMDLRVRAPSGESWPLVESEPGVYIAAIPLDGKTIPTKLVAEMSGATGVRSHRPVAFSRP